MKKSIRYLSAIIAAGASTFIMMPDSSAGSCPVLARLSGEWWQWAVSIPPSVNPLTDTTGKFCMVGQHGDTWFLGGLLGSTTDSGEEPLIVDRFCQVPSDRAIFFPAFNVFNFNSPGVCPVGSEPLTVAEIRAMLTPIVDQATDIFVELDGREIEPERVQSDVFSIAVPENNVLDPICGEGGLPRGVYSPAADEGFYVRLDPLSPGRHTLRFTGGIPGVFALDVTYHLDIVKVQR